MSFNQISIPGTGEKESLINLSHDLTIDEWIYLETPCVLLYKDGFMDIYPIHEYTGYELSMLRRDSSYRSAWIPIQYGSYPELQRFMYEILQEGVHAISAKLPKMKDTDVSNIGFGSRCESRASPRIRQ